MDEEQMRLLREMESLGAANCDGGPSVSGARDGSDLRSLRRRLGGLPQQR